MDSSDLQWEKHDLQRILSDDGIVIACTLERWNANSSIRSKCEPGANKTDESEPQNEKHDFEMTSTDEGIVIVDNPEK
jgi:hypothetical protein